MFSNRFERPIRTTRHAAARMVERNMNDALLLDLIETGTVKYKDDAVYGFSRTTPVATTPCCAPP